MNYVDAAYAPLRKTGQIKLYGPEAFAGMRKAGKLVAECLDMLVEHVKPGVPTDEINRLVFEFAMDHGALPATLMYRGYNKSTCTSINHVVCHGIPNEKPLKEGDIVNIDVTLILDGWHGDSSRMYPVGEIPRKAERLIEVTYDAMMRGIAAVKPGRTTGDIGHAIQSFVEPQHMSVVRDFCGHGLGRLDRGNARPFALGPVRAHRQRDAGRLRGVHHLADGPSQAALRLSIAASALRTAIANRGIPVMLRNRRLGSPHAAKTQFRRPVRS